MRNDSTVQFDDAKLEISAGDVLKNANLTVKFNSRLGGSIDSLIWEKGKFDFTAPNLISKGGGLFTSIIPENFAPGEISNRPFKRVSAGKDRIAFVTTVNSGKLNGLEMTRSYRLLPDGVEQEITLANKGKKNWKFPTVSATSSAPSREFTHGPRLIG